MELATRRRTRLAPLAAVASESRAGVPTALDADPLQRRANAVHDVLGLLERAEAIGFPERRSGTLRAAALRPDLAPRRLTRLERRVRAWMVRHRPHGH
jgi:hypothetical protein